MGLHYYSIPSIYFMLLLVLFSILLEPTKCLQLLVFVVVVVPTSIHNVVVSISSSFSMATTFVCCCLLYGELLLSIVHSSFFLDHTHTSPRPPHSPLSLLSNKKRSCYYCNFNDVCRRRCCCSFTFCAYNIR